MIRNESALDPWSKTSINLYSVSGMEQQLGDYFAGARKSFDLPLDFAGTPFQKKVWSELLNIPFGQTRTYGQIANSIGKPRAFRAVGAANGK